MSRALAAPIMVVEDDANDVFFVRQALETALIRNPVEVFDRAEPVYDYLRRHAAGVAPALIILDMHLAGPQTGLDVLTWIRQRSAPLGLTPVLVLTGSEEQEKRDASRRLGAMSYLQKPVTAESLTTAVQALGFSVINNIATGQLGIQVVPSHPVVTTPGAGATPGPAPVAPRPDRARFTYVRDDSRRRVRVTALVTLDAVDLAEIVERQASEGTWRFDIVYDLRATSGATTRADARQVADLVRRHVDRNGRRGRVAVITREITMLGIAQGYAYDTAKSGTDVQVFWDLHDAEAWLDQ